MKPRAVRADAERNRRHVLEVAQAVFAAEGLAVPIDEIARRAGLGVGTLYRHFPTKEALFSAIVVTRMQEVVAEARAAVESDTPGEAFFEFVTRMFSGWSRKKDMIDALNRAGIDLKDLAEAKHDLHRELGKLLERAQEAGAVRYGVTVPEIMALFGVALTSTDRPGISPEGRTRMLDIVRDGLRPPDSAPTSKTIAAAPKKKKNVAGSRARRS
jgi:AcrR family transcriptional regulator